MLEVSAVPKVAALPTPNPAVNEVPPLPPWAVLKLPLIPKPVPVPTPRPKALVLTSAAKAKEADIATAVNAVIPKRSFFMFNSI
jgi:hypothetical protein